MARSCIVAFAMVAAAARPGDARAQEGIRGHGEIVVVIPRIEQRTAAVSSQLTGTALGIVGSGGMGWFRLAVRYLQGPLRADELAESTTYVRGGALLTIHPVPFAFVGAGADAHAFVTEQGTEQWHAWQLLVGAEARLVPEIRAHLVLNYGFAGGLNSGVSLAGARGVSGGMRFQPMTRFPVWIAVAYGVDRAATSARTRVDVLEEFSLSIGIGRQP